MSEHLKGMKDAVMSGQGGGLQSVSASVGETIAGNSDMRGSQSKKSDAASESLGQFSQGAPGQTTSGTKVSASDQVTNMQTGSADHLDMNFRKKD